MVLAIQRSKKGVEALGRSEDMKVVSGLPKIGNDSEQKHSSLPRQRDNAATAQAIEELPSTVIPSSMSDRKQVVK